MGFTSRLQSGVILQVQLQTALDLGFQSVQLLQVQLQGFQSVPISWTLFFPHKSPWNVLLLGILSVSASGDGGHWCRSLYASPLLVLKGVITGSYNIAFVCLLGDVLRILPWWIGEYVDICPSTEQANLSMTWKHLLMEMMIFSQTMEESTQYLWPNRWFCEYPQFSFAC